MLHSNMISRLIELKFYVPVDTEEVISLTFFLANLFVWTEKKTKHNKCKQHRNKMI